MLRHVLISASAFFLSAVAFAQVHVGAGTQSCGQWVEARRERSAEDTVRKSMMTSWVQGYLVGTAMAVARERLIAEGVTKEKLSGAFLERRFGTSSGWAFDPPDPDATTVWIDKYCSANPLKVVSDAAGALAKELTYSNKSAAKPD